MPDRKENIQEWVISPFQIQVSHPKFQCFEDQLFDSQRFRAVRKEMIKE